MSAAVESKINGLYHKEAIPPLKMDNSVNIDKKQQQQDNCVDFNYPGESNPKLIFQGVNFVCQSTKGYFLKKLLTSLKFDNVAIICKPLGIVISEIDKDEQLLTTVHLDAKNFLNYYCPRSFYMQISLKKFIDVFTNIKKVRFLFTWSCSSTTGFDFDIYDEINDVHTLKSLASIPQELNKIEIGMRAEYPFRFKILISHLVNICKDVKKQHSKNNKSAIVLVKTQDDKLQIMTEKYGVDTNGDNDTSDNNNSNSNVAKIEDVYFSRIVDTVKNLGLNDDAKITVAFSCHQREVFFSCPIGNLGVIYFNVGKLQKNQD